VVLSQDAVQLRQLLVKTGPAGFPTLIKSFASLRKVGALTQYLVAKVQDVVASRFHRLGDHEHSRSYHLEAELRPDALLH
jgi:hypothetical protein